MKITLSKSQWTNIGIKNNWMRIARYGDQVKQLYLNQGINEQAIDKYIQEFDNIRKKKPKELFKPFDNINIPENKRNDISAYKQFKDLEFIVDYIKGQRTRPMQKADSNEQSNKIYEDDGLIIYRADTAKQAIDIKGDYKYEWCIARSNTGNLFNSYRYAPYEPTFYFVKDIEKDINDPYHFFVVQATKDEYIVTSGENDGDRNMSWDEILKIQPKLKDKENLIKWIPIPIETKQRLNTYREMNDDDFIKLSYEYKKEYIEYKGVEKISNLKFEHLPKDLKNLYISLGANLNEIQFNIIKQDKQLLQRYKEMCIRSITNNAFDGYLPEDFKADPQIQEAITMEWVTAISENPELYSKCPDKYLKDPRTHEAYINGWVKDLQWHLQQGHPMGRHINAIPEDLQDNPKIIAQIKHIFKTKTEEDPTEFHTENINYHKYLHPDFVTDQTYYAWENWLKKNPYDYSRCEMHYLKYGNVKNQEELDDIMGDFKEAAIEGWIKIVQENPNLYSTVSDEFKNEPRILAVLSPNNQVKQPIVANRLFSSAFNDNYIGKIFK